MEEYQLLLVLIHMFKLRIIEYLPKGTAFMSDVGMTGPYDGILGMEREVVLRRFVTGMPARFEVPKEGRSQLSAVYIEIDKKSGKAKKIERILINDDHPFYS